MVLPAFTGSTTFHVSVPASYDMEVASAKYLHGLDDGEVPLAFNFNGTVHYRGDDGRLQMSLIPWSCSAEFRLPVATWSDLIEHHYPNTGWIALHSGMASGANVILVPEQEFDIEQVARWVSSCFERDVAPMVVAAEGALPLGGAASLKTEGVDAFGHVRLGGIGGSDRWRLMIPMPE